MLKVVRIDFLFMESYYSYLKATSHRVSFALQKAQLRVMKVHQH